MSRNNQKARRKMNRQIKRHEEHLLNTCPDGEIGRRNMFARNVGANTPDGKASLRNMCDGEEERLSRRNIFGNADLTAYYALYNIENPKRPKYGF